MGFWETLWQWILGLFGLETVTPGTPPIAGKVGQLEPKDPPIADPRPPAKKDPPWLTIAKKYLGVKEPNSLIAQFHKAIGFFADWKTAWCSSFAGFCLIEAGLRSTRDPAARSYSRRPDLFVELLEPIYGCLVVYWRGSKDGWEGHVHFFLYRTARMLYGIGGNQDNMVCEKGYPEEQVIGYYWPKEFPLPPGAKVKAA